MIIYYFCKEFTILLRKIRYLLDFENNLKLEDMNRLKSVLLLCFVMMMAVSCKDKEEPVHTLQFDVEGLKLSYDAITVHLMGIYRRKVAYSLLSEKVSIQTMCMSLQSS